jgi:hypothetical protein
MNSDTFRENSQTSIPIYLITVTRNPNILLLEKVFDAVIEQNFKFEYMVIDNSNSEKKSELIKQSIEKKQNKISIRYEKENKSGIINARIKGLKSLDLDKESLIIFIDDDNIINPNYVKTALNFYQEHSRVGVFSGNAIFSSNQPNKLHRLIDLEFVLPYLGIRDFTYGDFIYKSLNWNKFEPIGAGICITNEVANEWLRLISFNTNLMKLGRNGKKLMSGEDSLFNLAANNLNLFSAYVSKLTLKHALNEKRFRIKYLTKLFYSYGRSHAIRESIFEPDKRKAEDLYSFFQNIGHIFRNKKSLFQFAMHSAELIGYSRQSHLSGHFQLGLYIFLKKIDLNLRGIRIIYLKQIQQEIANQNINEKAELLKINNGDINDTKFDDFELETNLRLITIENKYLKRELGLVRKIVSLTNSLILLKKTIYLDENKIIDKEAMYTITTGADQTYFDPLYYSVKRYFQNNSFDKSHIQFMIWDLGLSENQLTELKNLNSNILILNLSSYEKEPFKGAFSPENDCFAWKSFCIKHSMKVSGNPVLWLDAGVLLNRNPNAFVNSSLINGVGAIRNHTHKNLEWTSEKCKEILQVTQKELDAPQIQANILFFSKNEIGYRIVEEWCEFSSNPDAILGDSASHRHDQTILSILLSKHNIKIIDELIFEFEIFSKIDATSLDYTFLVHRGNI